MRHNRNMVLGIPHQSVNLPPGHRMPPGIPYLNNNIPLGILHSNSNMPPSPTCLQVISRPSRPFPHILVLGWKPPSTDYSQYSSMGALPTTSYPNENLAGFRFPGGDVNTYQGIQSWSFESTSGTILCSGLYCAILPTTVA